MFGVITLATSKGGAGKSTLARSLAAHWLTVGHKPALIDADPQRTLANRHDPAGKLGAVTLVAEPEERVADVIQELRAKHRPIIVDTAGFRNRTTISALVASELAIIPLKPSAEDVDAAIATYELIAEINETPERAGDPSVWRWSLRWAMHSTVITRHVRAQLDAERLSAPQSGNDEPGRLSGKWDRRFKPDHHRPGRGGGARHCSHCSRIGKIRNVETS